ncbi:hypothetical protein AWJ14_12605 [Hoeflea olei]|uniref:Uncharacterized protein n=1 Tax=Hoeflea olei TaxID=1480615 RepID=A0A1C1YRP7_9HYPH|nr:hypothetical protein AWJ14_12605 [Hoeflea olei]
MIVIAADRARAFGNRAREESALAGAQQGHQPPQFLDGFVGERRRIERLVLPLLYRIVFDPVGDLRFAGQTQVDEARNRQLAEIGKAALHQRMGFERQLRVEQNPRFLARGSAAGLVIDDPGGAVGAQVDAVGHAGEPDAGERQVERGACLDQRTRQRWGMGLFPRDQGLGRLGEAEPPGERQRIGQLSCGKVAIHDPVKHLQRSRALLRLRNEILQDRMVERAALARAGLGEEGIERIEPEHPFRIDCVRIAAQRLDLREGVAVRLQFGRRARFGPGRRRRGRPLVETPRMGEQRRAAHPHRGCGLLACDRQQPLQPARSDRRRLAGAEGAREHHFRRAHRHFEIMGGLADAPFGRFEPDRRLHRARQERVFLAGLRPDAFVEPAHHQRVDMLQPRFERAPDEGARMAAAARFHHPARNQRFERADPFAAPERQGRITVAGFEQQPGKVGAGFVAPERIKRAGVIGADPFQRPGGDIGERPDRKGGGGILAGSG